MLGSHLAHLACPSPAPEARPYAESQRRNKDAIFTRGASGLAPSGHPKGTDFWPRERGKRVSIPHRIYEEASPKAAPSLRLPGTALEDPLTSFYPSAQGRRVLGPGSRGELRPHRGRTHPPRSRLKFGGGSTRSDSAPRIPGSRPAGPGAAPLTLETLGGLRCKH